MRLTARATEAGPARLGAGTGTPEGLPGMAWPGVLVARAVSAAQRWAGRRGAQLIAVAAVTAAAVASGLQHHPTVDFRLALAAAVAATAPLAFVHRYPGPALAVMLGAQAGMLVFGRLSWTPVLVLVWLFTLALCPLLLSRAAAVGALAVMEFVIAAGPFAPAAENSTPWDATAAEAAAAVVAWGAGEYLRARRHAQAERQAVATRLRALLDADAASRERVELARELHDVVAHHVSLIAVKAATAPYAAGPLPAAAATTLDEIASQARTALTELRTVLGVLRTPGAPAADAPLQGLADVPELVNGQQRETGGVTLALQVAGHLVPESVQLCAYRIVQEALTNARRHAPGSQVQVTIRADDEGLHVTVRDSGGPGHRVTNDEPQPGFGLRGITERVDALGGTVRAGAVAGGGFEVAAVMPLPKPA